MQNYKNHSNEYRRYKAHVSFLGTTQLHLKNPYIVAWWSAAFPGFGHMLLSKYLRGYILFIWEVFINVQANINTAMVDSFCGKVNLARAELNTRWLLLYIPVFIFAIWDSYRTCVDMNNVYLLAERESAPFNSFTLGAAEINYLDKRNPVMSVVWSFLMPGLGQLYIHRIMTATFALIWSIVFSYVSHLPEALQLLMVGDIDKSKLVINREWLLFTPSMWGFAVYDSYINTTENNKLYDNEQMAFLLKNYHSSSFRVKRGTVMSR